jgi:hypothetical protein
LFELEDGFYSAPDISSKATASKRVSLAESELDSASVNTENSQTKVKKRKENPDDLLVLTIIL